MSEHTHRVAGALLAAATLAGAQEVPAPETQNTPAAEMPPVVVTASRLNRAPMEMAANATVISAEEIRGSGLIDTAQALETLGGVYLRRYSGNPSQVDVAMRGFGENSHGRVLFLVNGLPVNNADMAAPNLQRVPLENVERIEIIRGPQSALQGNNAVAGVVNIVTKAPAAETSGTVSAYAGSDDTYGAAVSVRGPIADDTHYNAAAVWDRSAGWRDNAFYRSLDFNGGVTQTFTERLDATISAFYNNHAYGMPGTLSYAQMMRSPRMTESPDNTYQGQLWGVGAVFNGATENDARLTLATAASRRDSTSEMVSWGNASDVILDTVQLSPRASLPFDLGEMKDTLTLGGDLSFERLAFRNRSLATGRPAYDTDLNRLTGAFYAQNELQLTEQLAFLLGGRLERSRLRAGTVYHGMGNNNDGACHTGGAWDAGLLFRPADDVKLFARAGSVYRYPFIDEQVSYNGGWPYGVNTRLSPERGMNYEVGAGFRFLDECSFDLSVYNMDMRDEIAVDPATWEQMNMNRTRHQGVDAGLSWRRPGVAAAGIDYGFVRSKFRSGDESGCDVPLAPRHVATVRGEVSCKTDFALLAALRGVAPQWMGSDFANRADKLNGYATLDLALRYKPSPVKGLQLIASCDNVLDKTYANMGYFVDMMGWGPDIYGYYPANGRTWRFSASYSF